RFGGIIPPRNRMAAHGMKQLRRITPVGRRRNAPMHGGLFRDDRGGASSSTCASPLRTPSTHMRIVTWNCYRGDYLERVTDLAPLQPYADFLRAAPSIVVGDFNCFAR